MKKKTTRRAIVKVIGPVPFQDGVILYWKVRLVAPYLPFYLDSQMRFSSLSRADEFAKRWKRRKIVLAITM